MSVVKKMIEPLNALSQQIWDDSLDDSAFDTLRQKVLKLSAQIAVHQVLQNTARHLLGPQNSPGLSNTQSRLGKFIDVMYGKPDNEKNEARWQKLRDMDCAAFLLIAVSYTPLDITKMHRIEFDYLVGNISKFLHVKALPPKWIFRKEIQIAIAGKADLEEADRFRMKYYALEFSPDILSPYGPQPDDQSNVSEAQVEPLNNRRNSTSSAASTAMSPLTDTGAGAILASIKGGLGRGEDGAQKAPRSIQPKKRRHIGSEVEQFPTMETEGLAMVQTGRQIQFMFSKAPTSQIPHLSSLILDAIQSSHQWKMESKRGEPTTDCLTIMIPKDPTQDISITLWVGQRAGLHMRDMLKLQPTWSSLPSHLSL